MISFILGRWQIVALLAFLATAGAGFAIHKVSVWITDLRHQHEIARLQETMNKQCEADKALTSEVSNAYQKQVADLNRRVAAYKRMHKPTCIAVTSRAAIGHNAASWPEPAGRDDGINSEALIDYAGKQEDRYLRLLGCQDFIRKTWKAKSHER